MIEAKLVGIAFDLTKALVLELIDDDVAPEPRSRKSRYRDDLSGDYIDEYEAQGRNDVYYDDEDDYEVIYKPVRVKRQRRLPRGR